MDAESTVTFADPYRELLHHVREAKLLASTAGLLEWDQETMMPAAGVDYRSRQLAQLARVSHQHATLPRIGELLEACALNEKLNVPGSLEAANLREIRRDYDRQTKLPSALVTELAETSSKALPVWQQARANSEFSEFQPMLEKTVTLLRRKAECLGWSEGGEPWDALADEYEPGMTAARIEALFVPLKKNLRKILDELLGSTQQPSNRFNELVLPIDKQGEFVRFVAERIGFDFDRGRLDTSTHPFCAGTHCHDIRMTTRFHDVDVNDALGSTMHETGHGIYEQGLPYEHVGTPAGESASLGIHESQSRMWENQVGRSLAFWKWCHPKLKGFFGSAVDGLTLEEIYMAANRVEPGFIRVEADEATYNLHIVVRFEAERALVRGDLEVADLPEFWNRATEESLSLAVPDDRNGCLQDIHWSLGAMGYFPTYTLGNLYCAQLFEKATEDLVDLDCEFERGDFSSLKTWLNENIHRHGRRYTPEVLCEKVTGKRLTAEPFLRHLVGKLNPIYGRSSSSVSL